MEASCWHVQAAGSFFFIECKVGHEAAQVQAGQQLTAKSEQAGNRTRFLTVFPYNHNPVP